MVSLISMYCVIKHRHILTTKDHFLLSTEEQSDFNLVFLYLDELMREDINAIPPSIRSKLFIMGVLTKPIGKDRHRIVTKRGKELIELVRVDTKGDRPL